MGPTLLIDGHDVPMLGVALLGVGVGYFAGMFGVGGGFIMTPLLVVLFGVPLPVAVGTGLCQMVGTSMVAYLRHRRLRQGEVRFDVLLLPGCLLGAELGTRLLTALAGAGALHVGARAVPWVSAVVEPLYLVLLVWVAGRYVQNSLRGADTLSYLRPGPLSRVRFGPGVELPAVGLRDVSGTMIAYLGLGLGFLSGLLGIGGGVALNPILIYGYGLPIKQAAGTGIAVLFCTAITGTVAHSLRGHVNLGLSMLLLVGGTLSAQVGALSSKNLSSGTLAKLQAAVVLSAAAAVLWDLLSKLL